MHVLAELGQTAIGLDQVLLEPARMRGGEADALNALDGMHALNQLDEGRDAIGMRVVAPAVTGDDLPEERELAHAPLRQLSALGHDLVHGPRALVAARLGHDAERAVHVAALLDRDEGADLSLVHLKMVADRVLRTRLFPDIHDARPDRHPGGAGRPQVIEVVGHLVKLLRADDQVDIGQGIEERGPTVLRHAAEDPEHEVGIASLSRDHIGSLTDRLLLRGVAHAAGVEQQDVADLLLVDDPVTPGTQHRRDSITVAFVHLTHVGFDEDAVHVPEGS